MSEEDEEHAPLTPIEGHFQDLFTARIKPPQFILEDLLPVGLTFVGAPPKAGKSTMVMGMVAAVVGLECHALPTFMRKVVDGRHGTAMIFSCEADAGELRYMVEHEMHVKGERNESILIADDPWEFQLDAEDGVAQLMHWLEERPPRIVVMDPFRDMHSQEEKDSGPMMQIIRPLREWAMKNEASVLIVHHTNKPAEGQTQFRESDLRGTGALFGKADGVIMLSPKGENVGDPVHIKAKFKRGKAWERVVTFKAYGVKAPASELMLPGDLQVLNAWRLGAKKVSEIAQQHNMPVAKVEASMLKLERNGMLVLRVTPKKGTG